MRAGNVEFMEEPPPNPLLLQGGGKLYFLKHRAFTIGVLCGKPSFENYSHSFYVNTVPNKIMYGIKSKNKLC